MEEVIEGGEGQVEERSQFVKMNLAISRQNKSLKKKCTRDGVDFLDTADVSRAIICPDPYDQFVSGQSIHLVEELQALLFSLWVEDARLQNSAVSSWARGRVKLHVVARI